MVKEEGVMFVNTVHTHSCGHPSRHPSECNSGGERDRERKKCHSQRNGGTLSARN